MNSRPNSGNTGNIPTKPNVYAGFDHAKQWEQTGDKVGTKWEQFYMMKLFIFSLSLPAAQPPAPILSPWLLTHFAGIERGRCSFGKSQRAAWPVDNYLRIVNLSDAYFLSTVHNVRKCMLLLINSLKRTKLSTMATLYNGRYVK